MKSKSKVGRFCGVFVGDGGRQRRCCSFADDQIWVQVAQRRGGGCNGGFRPLLSVRLAPVFARHHITCSSIVMSFQFYNLRLALTFVVSFFVLFLFYIWQCPFKTHPGGISVPICTQSIFRKGQSPKVYTIVPWELLHLQHRSVSASPISWSFKSKGKAVKKLQMGLEELLEKISINYFNQSNLTGNNLTAGIGSEVLGILGRFSCKTL